MTEAFHSWFFIAILGAILGAAVQITDAYLFEDNVFKHPFEPTIISGVMQAMFWLGTPFIGLNFPDRFLVVIFSFFGGIFHLLSLFFYFRAVFVTRDVSVIAIFWNLLLGAVPILAFLFLRETLSIREYIGIAILFGGSIVISYSKRVSRREFSRVFWTMMVAVFSMALSVTCLKWSYDQSGFFPVYLTYNIGIVTSSILFYAIFLKKPERSRLKKLTGKWFLIFFVLEFLQFSGEFFSSLAMSIGSVSLVTALESVQAVFVVILSWSAFFLFKFILRKKEYLAIAIRDFQMRSLHLKVVAILIMALGGYLLQP